MGRGEYKRVPLKDNKGCEICHALEEFLQVVKDEPDLWKGEVTDGKKRQLVALAKANLARHIKSGKHATFVRREEYEHESEDWRFKNSRGVSVFGRN